VAGQQVFPVRHPAALAAFWPLQLVIAVLAGAFAGVFARLLFAVLPDPWVTLANTSALWGLVPFACVVGLRATGRLATGIGVASLASMVAVWAILAPVPATARTLLLWGGIGIAAGAYSGLAGGLTRSDRPGFRWLASALIGGVVLGEAVYGLVLVGGPQWWFEGAVGVALILALGRSLGDRLRSLAIAAVIAAVLFVVFLGYDAIAVG
jgi:hypothetical protein